MHLLNANAESLQHSEYMIGNVGYRQNILRRILFENTLQAQSQQVSNYAYAKASSGRIHISRYFVNQNIIECVHYCI